MDVRHICVGWNLVELISWICNDDNCLEMRNISTHTKKPVAILFHFEEFNSKSYASHDLTLIKRAILQYKNKEQWKQYVWKWLDQVPVNWEPLLSYNRMCSTWSRCSGLSGATVAISWLKAYIYHHMPSLFIADHYAAYREVFTLHDGNFMYRIISV